jgi:hypothetical protein
MLSPPSFGCKARYLIIRRSIGVGSAHLVEAGQIVREVDAVPAYGITVPVVRNIRSLLMQGLLANSNSLGAIRRTVVNITDTVYVPTQVPSLLEEMLGHRHSLQPIRRGFCRQSAGGADSVGVTRFEISLYLRQNHLTARETRRRP